MEEFGKVLADFSDDAVHLFCRDRHEIMCVHGEEFPLLGKIQFLGPIKSLMNS